MADIKDLNAKQSVIYNDNKISLYQPEASTSRSNVYVRPGDVINFNFDIKAIRVEIINGDVHIVFANGSTMSLVSLAAIGFGGNAPVIRDLQGNLLSLDEFLNKAYVLNYNQAYLILTNKDNYQLSEDQPNLVSTASDNQTTFDGGTPVSGVGNIDVLTRGKPTQMFQPGAVDAVGSLRGTGEFALNTFTSSTPFSSNTSNILPGTKIIESRPNLNPLVLYGTELRKQNPVSLDIAGVKKDFNSVYQLAFLDSSAVSDQNVLLNTIDFGNSLANSTDNVFINNTAEYMDYVIELDYSKGIIPTRIDIILQQSEYSSGFSIEGYLGAGIDKPNTIGSFGGGLSGWGFTLKSIDSSGVSRYVFRLPYATSDRTFDVTYQLSYIDPNTGSTKDVFITQQLFVKAVSSIKDLVDGKNVLSSGSPGVNVTTGSGDDIILGGVGSNIIKSVAGNNMVFSGSSDDLVFLGSGNDQYWGSIGFDFVDGGSGYNTVYYNNQKIAIDPKVLFKDSYFNTYKSSFKLTIKIGLSVDQINALITGKKDSYLKYVTDQSIFVDQGGFYFDLLNNINYIVGSDLIDDIVEVSNNLPLNNVRISAGAFNSKSLDQVVIPKSVNAGAIFDFTKSKESDGFSSVYVYFGSYNPTILNNAGIFSNFNFFVGGSGDDIFYGGINYNITNDKQKDIQTTLAGSGGTNTIDYSKSKDINFIVFSANSGVVTKHYGSTEKQTDKLLRGETASGVVNKFSIIVGSQGADIFNASSNLNYEYQSGDSNFLDLVSYQAHGSTGGITLVINPDGSKYVYNGAFNNTDLASFATFTSKAFDKIALDMNVELGRGSDVIVSEETGSYTFSENNSVATRTSAFITGGKGAIGDTVSYIKMTKGIEISVNQDDNMSIVVTKNGGNSTDNFNFLYPSQVGQKTRSVDIYTIIGTQYNDTFFMNRGVLGLDQRVVGGGGLNTLSYANFTPLTNPSTGLVQSQGVNFILNGNKGFVEKIDGGRDFFEGFSSFIGTDLSDTFYINSLAFDGSFNFTIDLGAGFDFVDLTSIAISPSQPGALVSFELDAAKTLTMIIDFANNTKLTFKNTEGFVGTNGVDTFFVDDMFVDIKLSFNGGGGEDIADYSTFSFDLIVDTQKSSITKINTTGTSVVDEVLNTQVFKGGLGNNTFRSALSSSYTFIGNKAAVANGKEQSLDYSLFNTGVIFDFTTGKDTVYKASYLTPNLLDSIFNNSVISSVIYDKYSDITQFIGSKSSDAFLLDEQSDASRILNGGSSGFNIVDVSKYNDKVQATLTTANNVLNIVSGSTNKSFVTVNINGFRGTKSNDTFILIGAASYYIDGNSNSSANIASKLYDLVDYSSNSSLFFQVIVGSDIAVRKGSFFGSNDNTDTLKNIQKIKLNSQSTNTIFDSWSSSLLEIEAEVASGVEHKVDLSGFINAPSAVLNINTDATINGFIFTNIIAGKTEQIDLKNFNSIVGTNGFNGRPLSVVNIKNLTDIAGFVFNSVVLNFNGAIGSTSGLTLSIDNGIGSSSISTSTLTAQSITLININKFILTSGNDTVVVKTDLYSNSYYGKGGVDTLDYSLSTFNRGVIFSFNTTADTDSVNKIVGNVSKPSSSTIDSYYDFRNIIGTGFADTIEIRDLSVIRNLLLQTPAFNINLFGSNSSTDLDTIYFNINSDISYNMTSNSLFLNSSPSNSLNTSWISSVDLAGNANNLRLALGSAANTVLYGDATINYKIIDAGVGTAIKTLDATNSSIPLYFNAKTGKVSNIPSNVTNNNPLLSKEYLFQSFSNIIGSSIGNNYFYADLLGFKYTGSSNATDTLDYSQVFSNPLTFTFKNVGGSIQGTTSVSNSTSIVVDIFSNINKIIGSSQPNKFIFNQDIFSLLSSVTIEAGISNDDEVVFNSTTENTYILSATNINIFNSTDVNFTNSIGSLSFGNQSKVEIIQFNNINDTVIISKDVDVGYNINGYIRGNPKTDKNTIIYRTDNVFNNGNIRHGDVAVVFKSSTGNIERAITGSTSTTGRTVVDKLFGFDNIKYDNSNYSMVAIASQLPFNYSGTTGSFNLIVDYSEILFSTVGITVDMTSLTEATVTKGNFLNIFNDKISNFGSIIGSQANDTFILFERLNFNSATDKKIVVDGYSSGGNNSVSFEKFTNLSPINPSSPIAAGEVGNEYKIEFTNTGGQYSLSISGYDIKNISTYKFTNKSDKFIALDDTLTGQVNIDGGAGIDMLDYSLSNRDFIVDLVNGSVTRKPFINSVKALSNNSSYTDIVKNFERVITGTGDSLYIVKEDSFTSKFSNAFYLFEAQVATINDGTVNRESFNILNLVSVFDKKMSNGKNRYTLSLDFAYVNSKYESKFTIFDANSAQPSVGNTTISVGFTQFNTGRTDVNLTYDNRFKDADKNFNFAALGRGIIDDAVKFQYISSTSQQIGIVLKGTQINKYDVMVGNLAGNQSTISNNFTKIGSLSNYDEFNVGKSNTLVLETDAQIGATFIGGSGAFDIADFKSITANEVILEIIDVDMPGFTGAGVASKMKLTTDLNQNGVILDGFEKILLPNIDSKVILKERVGAGLQPIIIEAGTSTKDQVSFINFNNAVSGTNAGGYQLSGFETYQLTNKNDTWTIKENENQEVDGAGGIDTVNFINDAGISYSNGMILRESILLSNSYNTNVKYTTNKSLAGANYSDTLYNFEKFVLTINNDSFISQLDNLWNAEKITVNMGLGNNTASFDDFVITNEDKSNISDSLFDIVLNNANSNIKATFTRIGYTPAILSGSIILRSGLYEAITREYNLENVTLIVGTKSNNTFKLNNIVSSGSKEIKIVGGQISKNTLIVQDTAEDTYNFVFSQYDNIVLTTSKSLLTAQLSNISNYLINSINSNTKQFFRFSNFLVFDRNYTFSLNQYLEQSTISYKDFIAATSITYEIGNSTTKVYSGDITSSSVYHEITNLNIISSERVNNKIVINGIIDINIYGSINNTGSIVDIKSTDNLIITDSYDSNYFSSGQLTNVSSNDISGINKAQQSYVKIQKEGSSGVGAAINIFLYETFILGTGINTVNYYLSLESRTSEYNAKAGLNDTFVIFKDKTLALVGSIATGNRADVLINLTQAEYVQYIVGGSSRSIPTLGFEFFKVTDKVNFNEFGVTVVVDTNMQGNKKVYAREGFQNTVVMGNGVILNLIDRKQDITIIFKSSTLGVADKTLTLSNFFNFNFSTEKDTVNLNTRFFASIANINTNYVKFDIDGNVGVANDLFVKADETSAKLVAKIFSVFTNIFQTNNNISTVIGVRNFSNIDFNKQIDVFYSPNSTVELSSLSADNLYNNTFSFYLEQADGLNIDNNSLFGYSSFINLSISNIGTNKKILSSTLIANSKTIELTNFNSYNLGSGQDTVQLKLNKGANIVNINQDLNIGGAFQLSGNSTLYVLNSDDIKDNQLVSLTVSKVRSSLYIGDIAPLNLVSNFTGFSAVYLNSADLKDVAVNVEYDDYKINTVSKLSLYGSLGYGEASSSSLFMTSKDITKIDEIIISGNSMALSGIKFGADEDLRYIELSDFENIYFGYKSNFDNVKAPQQQNIQNKKYLTINNTLADNLKNYNFYAERSLKQNNIKLTNVVVTNGVFSSSPLDTTTLTNIDTLRNASDVADFSALSVALTFNFFNTRESGKLSVDVFRSYGSGDKSSSNPLSDHWGFLEFESFISLTGGETYFDFYNIDLSQVEKIIFIDGNTGINSININKFTQKVVDNYILDQNNNIKVVFTDIDIIQSIKTFEVTIQKDILNLQDNIIDSIIINDLDKMKELKYINTGLGVDIVTNKNTTKYTLEREPLRAIANPTGSINTVVKPYYDGRFIKPTENPVGSGLYDLTNGGMTISSTTTIAGVATATVDFSQRYDVIYIPYLRDSGITQINTGAGTDTVIVGFNFKISTNFTYDLISGGKVTLTEEGTGKTVILTNMLYSLLIVDGVYNYFSKTADGNYVNDYSFFVSDAANGLAKETPFGLASVTVPGDYVNVKDKSNTTLTTIMNTNKDVFWDDLGGGNKKLSFNALLGAATYTANNLKNTYGYNDYLLYSSINSVSLATSTAVKGIQASYRIDTAKLKPDGSKYNTEELGYKVLDYTANGISPAGHFRIEGSTKSALAFTKAYDIIDLKGENVIMYGGAYTSSYHIKGSASQSKDLSPYQERLIELGFFGANKPYAFYGSSNVSSKDSAQVVTIINSEYFISITRFSSKDTFATLFFDTDYITQVNANYSKGVITATNLLDAKLTHPYNNQKNTTTKATALVVEVGSFHAVTATNGKFIDLGSVKKAQIFFSLNVISALGTKTNPYNFQNNIATDSGSITVAQYNGIKTAGVPTAISANTYTFNVRTTYTLVNATAGSNLLDLDGNILTTLDDGYYIKFTSVYTFNEIIGAVTTPMFVRTYEHYIINVKGANVYKPSTTGGVWSTPELWGNLSTYDDGRTKADMNIKTGFNIKSSQIGLTSSNNRSETSVNTDFSVKQFSNSAEVLKIITLGDDFVANTGAGYDLIQIKVKDASLAVGDTFIKYEIYYTTEASIGGYNEESYTLLTYRTDGAYLILKQYKLLQGGEEWYTGRAMLIYNVFGDDIVDLNGKWLATIGQNYSVNTITLDNETSFYQLSNNFDVINLIEMDYYDVIDAGEGKDKIIIPNDAKYTVVKASTVLVKGTSYKTDGYYIKVDAKGGKVTYIINAKLDEIHQGNKPVFIVGEDTAISTKAPTLFANAAPIVINSYDIDDNSKPIENSNVNQTNEVNDNSLGLLEEQNLTNDIILINDENNVDTVSNVEIIEQIININEDDSLALDNLFAQIDQSNNDFVDNELDNSLLMEDLLITDNDNILMDSITSTVSNQESINSDESVDISDIAVNSNEMSESEIVDNYKLSDEGSDDVLQDIINSLNKNNTSSHS